MTSEYPMACIASASIAEGNAGIFLMYRDEPEQGQPDSGWRFFSGTEGTFVNNPNNSKIVRVIDIIADNPKLLPLLNSEIGTAYRMNDCKEFEKVM